VREATLETDGDGRWRINGVAAPALDACLDVDLESSALTNAFRMHRLGLEIGAQAPGARRSRGASRSRATRTALRASRQHRDRQRYSYSAPRFEFNCDLLCDAYGLVLDYPGIAVRAA
jgi:uncharacterized protein